MFRSVLIGFIFTILAATTVYAGSTAVVTGSRVNVRTQAEISDNVLFQVNSGEVIEIHGVDGDFFRASVNGNDDVYISRDFVRFTQTQGTVTEPFAWVDIFPGEEGILAMLVLGETVTVKSVYEDWYGVEINDTIGYIYRYAVEIPDYVELPAARIGTTLADEIIETAMSFLGSRYVAGGASPSGFDCSGFTYYVFAQHGISLERSSRYQVNNGYEVSRDELEPGDLLFFGNGTTINHVGLYIGDGQYIHASTESTGVIISNLDNSRRFVTARRVL